MRQMKSCTCRISFAASKPWRDIWRSSAVDLLNVAYFAAVERNLHVLIDINLLRSQVDHAQGLTKRSRYLIDSLSKGDVNGRRRRRGGGRRRRCSGNDGTRGLSCGF